MSKTRWLRITNSLLFISLVIQAITGLILFFNLFISNTKIFESLAELHKYNGLIFTILVAIHLYLNWGWVKSQFDKVRIL